MKVQPSPAQVGIMLSLSEGDKVVATNQSGIRWHGTVESVVPSQGLLWMHTDAGERKLVDLLEHSIHRPSL